MAGLPLINTRSSKTNALQLRNRLPRHHFSEQNSGLRSRPSRGHVTNSVFIPSSHSENYGYVAALPGLDGPGWIYNQKHGMIMFPSSSINMESLPPSIRASLGANISGSALSPQGNSSISIHSSPGKVMSPSNGQCFLSLMKKTVAVCVHRPCDSPWAMFCF